MRILIFDTPILRLQANTEILFFAWTDHFLRPEFTLNLNMMLFHQQNSRSRNPYVGSRSK